MNRVLVISPHPDDEAIGCGGTLRRHVVAGDAVRVLFLTSGERGGHGRPADETIVAREREAAAAADILGIRDIEFWHEPDGQVRARRETAGRLAALLAAWKAGLIYVPHEEEMHPDHRAAARLVRRALSLPATSRRRPEVRMYEIWTPLQQLDEIVDISEHLGTKLRAIRAYRCQCAVMRLDEAARGLNRYRGEMHLWPGGDYAEAFRRMRW